MRKVHILTVEPVVYPPTNKMNIQFFMSDFGFQILTKLHTTNYYLPFDLNFNQYYIIINQTHARMRLKLLNRINSQWEGKILQSKVSLSSRWFMVAEARKFSENKLEFRKFVFLYFVVHHNFEKGAKVLKTIQQKADFSQPPKSVVLEAVA